MALSAAQAAESQQDREEKAALAALIPASIAVPASAEIVEPEISESDAPNVEASAPLQRDVVAAVVEPIEQVHVAEPVLEQADVEPVAETVEDLPSVGAQRWIESLRAGCWCLLSATESQSEQRCKLAAIISFSGKYIFVNRGGMKVAEFGKSELTRHFDQGLIALLDENQLFDRALESVIGNLRRLQSAKS